MKLLEHFNPMRLADRMGHYYIAVVFGTMILLFAIGSRCG